MRTQKILIIASINLLIACGNRRAPLQTADTAIFSAHETSSSEQSNSTKEGADSKPKKPLTDAEEIAQANINATKASEAAQKTAEEQAQIDAARVAAEEKAAYDAIAKDQADMMRDMFRD